MVQRRAVWFGRQAQVLRSLHSGAPGLLGFAGFSPTYGWWVGVCIAAFWAFLV